MHDLLMNFINLLKEFSYLGIIIALSIETIPGEIVLPLAGYWVYLGDFNFGLTVLAGVTGGVIGPLTLYALGRYGGRPMILRYGKYFFINEKHLTASETFFEKYGFGVAFFGRFIPGIRTAISIPCGIAKMNVWKFTFFTFLAMLPVTILYVYLGYQLGENWEQVGSLVNPYLRPLGLIILLAIVSLIFIKLRRKHIKNSIIKH
jgi:membrane protein DedA with SNARE-associated domain